MDATSPNATFDPCAPNESYIFVFKMYMYGLTPLIFVGIVLNSLCVVIFHRQKSHLTSVHLLKMLAFCDLMFLVVCGIFFTFRHLYVLLTDSVAVLAHPDNQIAPHVYYTSIAWYFMVLQMRNWIVVLVSTDRYLNLAYPMWARTALTKAKMNAACLVIFVVSVATHLPRYWGQYLEPYTDPCPTISQDMKISYHPWEAMYDIIIYMCANVFAPLILLYFLNIALIVALRRAQKARRALSNQAGQKDDFRAQVQATTMVISVVVIFTVCETPVVFDRVVQMMVTLPDDDPFLNYARKLGLLLVIIDSTINFVGYTLTNHRFRQGLRMLLCGGDNKDSWQSSDDGRSTTQSRTT